MKKVLIFTLPTGNGHNQVAKSISKMLSNSETQVKIVNPLDESNIFIKAVIQSGYIFTASRVPFLYSKLYKYSNKKTIPFPIAEFYQRKLLKLLQIHITSEKPDMVISVHPLINQSLSKIKKNLSFPLISFITDYRCHKFYIAENIDFYIMAVRKQARIL
jgi:processive 1,2-diacylglycerol beta-glucosyltransferase